jgi:hypothetical protein
VNEATPELFVVPDTVVIVSFPPRLELKFTVFPETPFEFESFKVTVIVETVDPSAVTEVGLALTVDCEALTGPAVNETDAV